MVRRWAPGCACCTEADCDWNGCTKPSVITLGSTYVDSPRFEDLDGNYTVGTYAENVPLGGCVWSDEIWTYTDGVPDTYTVDLFILTTDALTGGVGPNVDYDVLISVTYGKNVISGLRDPWEVTHEYEWSAENQASCPSAGTKTATFARSITLQGSPPAGTAPGSVTFDI